MPNPQADYLFETMVDWIQRLTLPLPRTDFLQVYHSEPARSLFIDCETLLEQAGTSQEFTDKCHATMIAWRDAVQAVRVRLKEK